MALEKSLSRREREELLQILSDPEESRKWADMVIDGWLKRKRSRKSSTGSKKG